MELHAGVLTVDSLIMMMASEMRTQKTITASAKLSGRLDLSGGGAWGRSLSGSTLMEEMFCIPPLAELWLIFSVCLELTLTDANSSGPGAAEASTSDGENPGRGRFLEVLEGRRCDLFRMISVELADSNRIYAFD